MSHILSSLFILCYSVAFPRFCGDCPCLLFDTLTLFERATPTCRALHVEMCVMVLFIPTVLSPVATQQSASSSKRRALWDDS